MESRHETLFVGNIDQKLKKHDLEHSLFELFVPFGHVREIKFKREQMLARHDKSKYKKAMPLMKTIAFVVFATEAHATAAKAKLNNFPFFGRNLFIDFARKRGDAACMADGTFDFAADAKQRGKDKIATRKIAIKNQQVQEIAQTTKEVVGEPSTTLVVEGLAEHLTEEVMRPLFEQFPGLVELTHFPTQNRIKCEFKHEDHASQCLRELQGFNVDGKVKLKIVFGA
ncbi:unnamed protein product [Amoebophrya sp. A25]|nr:unnamed protein product [Amoebophrya sp. A25]|eukprot:GSA25T00010392001.1